MKDNGERFADLCPQDVRVKQGADVASDHHLFFVQLILKKELDRVPSKSKHTSSAALEDTWKQEEFMVTLFHKFQVLEELLEEETIRQKWQKVKIASTFNKKMSFIFDQSTVTQLTPSLLGGFTHIPSGFDPKW
ncbi:hypothetical protein DPMN_088754 [Dreissena polymorpha]|uniref:Uncharacterized protein n=1 Tax=Dreissena polymorpha TaxID=45954 RepID=A0A9D4KVJ7_DREPO|nr:hypothetical protein DPMN_088754 [Dreissena polymorpha]